MRPSGLGRRRQRAACRVRAGRLVASVSYDRKLKLWGPSTSALDPGGLPWGQGEGGELSSFARGAAVEEGWGNGGADAEMDDGGEEEDDEGGGGGDDD